MKYSKGDYFGELALLQKDSKRKATITAVTDCVLMCVDREGFTRILGPLDTILKRNMIKYEKYTRIKPE
jgi:cAMP-dependent protein kinase regulator